MSDSLNKIDEASEYARKKIRHNIKSICKSFYDEGNDENPSVKTIKKEGGLTLKMIEDVFQRRVEADKDATPVAVVVNETPVKEVAPISFNHTLTCFDHLLDTNHFESLGDKQYHFQLLTSTLVNMITFKGFIPEMLSIQISHFVMNQIEQVSAEITPDFPYHNARHEGNSMGFNINTVQSDSYDIFSVSKNVLLIPEKVALGHHSIDNSFFSENFLLHKLRGGGNIALVQRPISECQKGICDRDLREICRFLHNAIPAMAFTDGPFSSVCYPTFYLHRFMAKVKLPKVLKEVLTQALAKCKCQACVIVGPTAFEGQSNLDKLDDFYMLDPNDPLPQKIASRLGGKETYGKAWNKNEILKILGMMHNKSIHPRKIFEFATPLYMVCKRGFTRELVIVYKEHGLKQYLVLYKDELVQNALDQLTQDLDE